MPYTTNSASVEGGYATRTMQFSLNYLYSRFDNDNTTLQWNNPFFGGNLDTTYLPSTTTTSASRPTPSGASCRWLDVRRALHLVEDDQRHRRSR